jgi:GNAT superfamily N-acetyltransferase
MKVRHPNPGDWEGVLDLARQMHRESWFSEFDFAEGKVQQLFEALLERPDWLGIVAENMGGELVGFFAAATVEHFFGHDTYACDLVNYVLPNYRNGLAARRFVKVYETWCRIRGVKEIHVGVSTGRNAERIQEFYEKLGFHSPAVGLRKKCVVVNTVSP